MGPRLWGIGVGGAARGGREAAGLGKLQRGQGVGRESGVMRGSRAAVGA